MGYIPTSGKVEMHITYRCNLTCTACTRESFLARPHTPDMTLEDLHEFFRQADAIGWKNMPGPGNGAERPRIVLIGGEPTLHPDFLEFVDLIQQWSSTYVQIFSNGTTQKSKALLAEAERRGASIQTSTFKPVSIRSEKDSKEGWWCLTTCVSPVDAGIEPLGKCFSHCSEICGLSVDHNGYSPCAVGHSASTVLGLGAVTKNLADLWDEEKAKAMTLAQCKHCGWNVRGRYGRPEDAEAFEKYAMQLPKLKSETLVSPTWEKALRQLEKP
jgi:hypothetical protein